MKTAHASLPRADRIRLRYFPLPDRLRVVAGLRAHDRTALAAAVILLAAEVEEFTSPTLAGLRAD